MISCGTFDYPSYDTLKKHLNIFYCKLCRNTRLYFIRCFSEVSDFTLWNFVQKHLIILHEIFVQKLVIMSHCELSNDISVMFNYNLTLYGVNFVSCITETIAQTQVFIIWHLVIIRTNSLHVILHLTFR
jgi:hypothetical protein